MHNYELKTRQRLYSSNTQIEKDEYVKNYVEVISFKLKYSFI